MKVSHSNVWKPMTKWDTLMWDLPIPKIRTLLKAVDRFYLLLVEFVYFEQLEAYINDIIGIYHRF